jgi:hypothetical protein
MGAWASIDDNCPIACVVSDDTAELLFGGLSGPLSLLASANVLETLVSTASEALRTLRGTPIEHNTDTADPGC